MPAIVDELREGLVSDLVIHEFGSFQFILAGK